MSKEMDVMEEIQNQKVGEMHRTEILQLDDECMELAGKKLFAIDDQPVIPVDPLR